MPIYYNSSGAGDYLESDGNTYTWAAGDDANDGSSRLLPKLTANYLDSVSDVTPGLGDAQIFNQGTYNYTANGGRLIIPVGLNLVSAQEVDGSAKIVFVGSTETQGFRTNSASTDRSCSVGKGIVLSSSGTITNLIYVSHGGAARYTYTFNCQFEATSNLNNLLNRGTLGPSTYNLGDGFGIISSDASVSLNDGIVLTSMSDLIVNQTAFYVSWTAGAIVSSGKLFSVQFTEGASGSFSGVVPTGTINIDNSAGSLTLYEVIRPPTSSVIEQIGDTSCDFSTPVNQVTHVAFTSEAADVTATTNLLIYRDLSSTARMVSNAQNGYGFIIGTDGDTDTNPLAGYILNVKGEFGAELSGSIHGVMHGGCTAGSRLLNHISGAGIGSITKNGDGDSFGNYITNLNIVSGEYCFAKATDAGVIFRGDRCVINRDTDAILTVASDSGLQIANDPLFDGIQAIYGGGNFTSLVHRDSDSSGELSESSHDSIVIDERIDLTQASSWFRRILTNYTIAESEALVSNPFVNTLVGVISNRSEIEANDTALAAEIIAVINSEITQLSTLTSDEEDIIRSKIVSSSVFSTLVSNDKLNIKIGVGF